jgi:hypothetical protein
MAVVGEVPDQTLDLMMASFGGTPRTNPQAATRLPSDAIGELLNDVGGAFVISAGNCGSQPAKGFAVAGRMMSIRSLPSLRRSSALRPSPATPPLNYTLLSEKPLFFVGRESAVSPPRLGLRRIVKFVGLRMRADTVIGYIHLSNHQ